MTLSRKSRFWVGGILLAFGLIAITVVYNGPPYVPPGVPVPNPNGYDDFIAAAKLRESIGGEGVLLPGDSDFTLKRARKQVAECQPVVERVQIGLTRPVAVPIEFTTNWIRDHLNTLADEKKLALLLGTFGYVAEQDGRLHEAVKFYVDGLKFGTGWAANR